MRGRCTQSNLAIKEILDYLGVETKAVFSLRVHVDDNPAWTMGHTWLRVTIDGETRGVCASRADIRPDQVNFVPLAPVWPGNRFTLLLTRRPLPGWMFEARRFALKAVQ